MSDSQNSSDRKQSDKITQLQIQASRKNKDDFKAKAVGMKAKSTGIEVKARATDTKDKAMNPEDKASSHSGLKPEEICPAGLQRCLELVTLFFL